MKLPPYGKQLESRLRFGNRPLFVVVCAGLDDWQRAKRWNSRSEVSALVLPSDVSPGALSWPVRGFLTVVDWDVGPSGDLIEALVRALLIAGSLRVTVRPLFSDPKQPSELYDLKKQEWVRQREVLRSYPQVRISDAA